MMLPGRPKWPRTVEPISPKDVLALKEKVIPPEVIEAFNEMIARGFDGRRSTFLQKDVGNLIIEKLSVNGKKPTFKTEWLDVESLYENKGWKVEYDKPGYNETYEASFVFTVSKGSHK